MKEIYQRRKELNITQDEWFEVWMLGRMRKRKIMDDYEIQNLRDVVKEGGDDIIDRF